MKPDLWKAITLRRRTRAALDRDDMPAVRYWDSLADVAYRQLGPFEACAYLAWTGAGDRGPAVQMCLPG